MQSIEKDVPEVLTVEGKKGAIPLRGLVLNWFLYAPCKIRPSKASPGKHSLLLDG